MINLIGKLGYIVNLIKTYSTWYEVLLGRFMGKPLKGVKLRNGLYIISGEKSLVTDLVDEIFIKEIYTPKFLRIEKGDTVVDVGANLGAFSLYAAQNGAKNIIDVEPLPQNISLIKRNFHINKFSLPQIEGIALSDKKGFAKLYLGDLDSHNSLFDHNFLNTKFEKYIWVRTATLKDVLDKENIKHVDFLKIDCEGSEGQIVASTPIAVWKDIDKVVIEYHDGVAAYSHTDIVTKLKSVGFKTVVKTTDRFLGYIYAFRKC